MNAIVQPKCHVRGEALEFCAATVELLPPNITGDELRIAADDEVIRERIAAAYAEILSPKMLFGAKEVKAVQQVAAVVKANAGAHMRDHVEAMRRLNEDDEGPFVPLSG